MCVGGFPSLSPFYPDGSRATQPQLLSLKTAQVCTSEIPAAAVLFPQKAGSVHVSNTEPRMSLHQCHSRGVLSAWMCAQN